MTRRVCPVAVGEHVHLWDAYHARQASGVVVETRWDHWLDAHRLFVRMDGQAHPDGSPVIETRFQPQDLLDHVPDLLELLAATS